MAMLISLIAGAYLTNLPNLADSLIININKSHAHNKNFHPSSVSQSCMSEFPISLASSLSPVSFFNIHTRLNFSVPILTNVNLFFIILFLILLAITSSTLSSQLFLMLFK